MKFNVFLSGTTIARLKKNAEPLVDTFDTVVMRALDALENAKLTDDVVVNKFDEGIPLCNPAAPPSLSYTTVHSITFNGRSLVKTETYWNSLLMIVIREAGKILTIKEVKSLILGNSVFGCKEDNGYKFIKELGISIQGRDANNAWQATYHILKKVRFPVEVVFSWQENPKAASPGKYARFDLRWD